MTTPVMTTRFSGVLARSIRLVPAFAVAAAIALAPPGAHAEPTLDEQIDEASHDLEVVVEDYNKAAEELKTVTARAQQIEAALVPLRDIMAANDEDISAIAVHYYRTGGLSELTALLTGSAVELGDRMMVLDYLARQQNEELTSLLETQSLLEEEQTTVTALLDEKKRLEGDLAEKKATIEDRLGELTQMRDSVAFTAGETYALGALPSGDGGAEAVRFAHAQLGAPYQWGSEGPNGFDCSGLTTAAWRRLGVSLPHNAAMQYAAVHHISRDQLAPGDLVFYYGDLHHVALYAGEGKIIHAPQAGQSVAVAPIDSMPVVGYGRPG